MLYIYIQILKSGASSFFLLTIPHTCLVKVYLFQMRVSFWYDSQLGPY